MCVEFLGNVSMSILATFLVSIFFFLSFFLFSICYYFFMMLFTHFISITWEQPTVSFYKFCRWFDDGFHSIVNKSPKTASVRNIIMEMKWKKKIEIWYFSFSIFTQTERLTQMFIRKYRTQKFFFFQVYMVSIHSYIKWTIDRF